MNTLEIDINTVASEINVEIDGTDKGLSVGVGSDGGVLFSGSAVKVTQVVLRADAWVGNSSPYSQVIDIEDVTENSLVDLQPSAEQLQVFHNKDLAFVSENDNGVVTIFAIGDKPMNDYTIQATVMEVRL